MAKEDGRTGEACSAAGRGTVEVFDQGREGEMSGSRGYERARDEGRLRLTEFNLRQSAKQSTHCEILLRMLDERGKLFRLQCLYPRPEKYGLMPALDRWVVTRAFEN